MPESERQGVQMQPASWAAAIDRIPDDRMANVGQMGPKLMGAAGQRPQPKLRAVME